jgi:hypothetical protein
VVYWICDNDDENNNTDEANVRVLQ